MIVSSASSARAASSLPLHLLLLAPLRDACTLKGARTRSFEDPRMRVSLSPFFLRSAISRLHLIIAPANGADRNAANIAKSNCVFPAHSRKLSTISHACKFSWKNFS